MNFILLGQLPEIVQHAIVIATGFSFHPILWIVPLTIFLAFYESKHFGFAPLQDAFGAGGRLKLTASGFFAGMLLAKVFATAYLLGIPHIFHNAFEINPGQPAKLRALQWNWEDGFLIVSIALTLLIFGYLALKLIWSTARGVVLKLTQLRMGVDSYHVLGFAIAVIGNLLFYWLVVKSDVIGSPFYTFISRPVAWITGYDGTDNRIAPLVLSISIDIIPMAITIWFIVAYWLKARISFPSSLSVCLFLSQFIGVYGLFAYASQSLAFMMVIVPFALWGLKGWMVRNNFPFQRIAARIPLHDEIRVKSPALNQSNSKGLFEPEIKIAANANGSNARFSFNDPTNPRIIIVTTTGGGISAATWTVAVLNRLSRENATFNQDLRVVTGASGGMVGAAFYAKNLLDTLATLPKATPPTILTPATLSNAILDRAYQWIGRDHLAPVVSRLAFHDALWNLFPTGQNTFDRGLALEQSFSDAWGMNPESKTEITLADFQKYEAAGQLPSLVFSPMIVESGRRLLLSNLDLSSCYLTGGHLLDAAGKPCEKPMSVSAKELRLLAPDVYKSLLLSTAARMNASYPYVSPAGILMGTYKAIEGQAETMRLRVGDAGYYDNLGVNIAARWLLQYRDFFRTRVHGNLPSILMIQIRVTPSYQDGLRFSPDRSTALSRGFEWVSSPPEAVYSSLFQSMQYHNDENIEDLSKTFGDNFATAILECPEKMPLSWALNDDELEAFENWAYAGAMADAGATTMKDVKSQTMLALLKIKEDRAAESSRAAGTKVAWDADAETKKLAKWFANYLGEKNTKGQWVQTDPDRRRVIENAAFLEMQFKGIQAYLKRGPVSPAPTTPPQKAHP